MSKVDFNIICRGDNCGTMYIPSTNQYVEYHLDNCNWMGGAYDYISSYYEISEAQSHIIPQLGKPTGKFLGRGRSIDCFIKE